MSSGTFQKLQMELWSRRVPRGVISPKYLFPIKDQRIQMHRKLWWESYTGKHRVFWLLTELWIWLKWVSLFGWLACYRAIKLRGDKIFNEFGISKYKQTIALIKLCVGRTILPRDVYRFGLFKLKTDAWDFVYDREIDAYHDLRNRQLGADGESKALLADKFRFSKTLEDVPTAPILACVSKGESFNFNDWLDHESSLFIKMRSGHRAFGAFSVWKRDGQIKGKMLSGKDMQDEKAVNDAASQLLDLGDFLVQPKLENHPKLNPLTESSDAITIRYITTPDGNCLSATIEIPAGSNETLDKPSYLILPIEKESGLLEPIPTGHLTFLNGELYEEIISRVNSNQAIPGWSGIVSGSAQSHSRLPDLWAVAWDWIVTPDGPRLLEGNSNWDGYLPQMLNGGFLGR